MIIVIDNHDSYVYNLVQYLRADGDAVAVYRNDEVTIDQIRALRPELVVVSPGPGAPAGAGVSVPAMLDLDPDVPVFGVCLGHQVLGHAYGAVIRRAGRPMHGRLSKITHDGRGVFAGLPDPITVIRYHSLVVDEASLPECLEVTARAEDGEVMGLRHRYRPIESVQFHPESIFTEHGRHLVRNAAAARRLIAS